MTNKELSHTMLKTGNLFKHLSLHIFINLNGNR